MLALKFYLILAAMIIRSPADYSISPYEQAKTDAFHAVIYVEAMEQAIAERKARGR